MLHLGGGVLGREEGGGLHPQGLGAGSEGPRSVELRKKANHPFPVPPHPCAPRRPDLLGIRVL